MAEKSSDRKGWGIARRAFLSILATCLSMIIAWDGLLLLRGLYVRNDDRIASAQFLADRLAYALTNPLWTLDTPEVIKVARYELNMPEVYAIVVTDGDGKILISDARGASDGAENPTSAVPFDPGAPLARGKIIGKVEREVRKFGHGIGRLTIYVAGVSAGAIIESTMREKAVEIIFFTTVLMAVILMVVKRSLIRPISELASSLARVPAGSPLPVPNHGAREIKSLAQAFNGMTESLAESFSEKERLLEELGRQQELLLSLASNVPGIIFRSSLPPDYRVQFLSDDAYRLLGQGKEELLSGKAGLRDSVISSDRKALDESILDALSRGDRYTVEYRIFDDNGSEKWIHETGRATEEQGGRGRWIDAMAIDITEEKANGEKLFQAQKMEIIGTLAGGIAHDFNNILNVIIGATSLIRFSIERGKIDLGDISSKVSLVDQAASRAASLVGQLLTLSRRQETKLIPVDLVQSLDHIRKFLSGSLDKSISVAVSASKGPIMALADPLQLEQVLLNLCINAGHAMTIMRPAGESWGGLLSMRIERCPAGNPILSGHPEAENRDYWILSISDTGIGMGPATVARLFTPFFTTKAKGLGTGLGLSIVYSIMKSHQGFIGVESKPHEGTTFSLFFPAVDESALPAMEESVPADFPRGEGTILIVEDEDAIRDMAERILADSGYTVFSAANGEKALKLFREIAGKVDLVIMDMVMPVLSGRETFREMRSISPSVKVLLCSGFKSDERVQEILREEGVSYLDKPYSLHALALTVRQLLKGDS